MLSANRDGVVRYEDYDVDLDYANRWEIVWIYCVYVILFCVERRMRKCSTYNGVLPDRKSNNMLGGDRIKMLTKK